MEMIKVKVKGRIGEVTSLIPHSNGTHPVWFEGSKNVEFVDALSVKVVEDLSKEKDVSMYFKGDTGLRNPVDMDGKPIKKGDHLTRDYGDYDKCQPHYETEPFYEVKVNEKGGFYAESINPIGLAFVIDGDKVKGTLAKMDDWGAYITCEKGLVHLCNKRTLEKVDDMEICNCGHNITVKIAHKLFCEKCNKETLMEI